MSADQQLIAIIRIVNALLWLELGIDLLWRHPRDPLPTLPRRLVFIVIVAGMVLLAIGGFAPYYVPADTTRYLYTTYAGFAAMVAFAIRRTWRA